MAENNEPTQDTETSEPEVKERTFTQDELNKIISERTAKYRKDKDELRESLEKLRTKFDKVSAAYGELSGSVERARVVDSVAKSVGLDRAIVESLSGETEEELTEAAKRIADAIKPAEDEADPKKMYVPNLGYAPSTSTEAKSSDPLGDLVRSM